MNNPNPKTLYDKLWDTHFVGSRSDNGDLLYIDLHMVHEVTSPQAFEGLKIKGIGPRRVDSIVATVDHNVPTTDRSDGLRGIKDTISRDQIQALQINCHDFGIDLIDLNDLNQGIVHVVGPEQGFTQPGMTIVCGDSHTSTHGALGCLAMGIGTSEVEHVLATQCLKVSKLKNMNVRFEGVPQENVSSKDIVLYLIGKIGTAGGTGYAIEFSGSYIDKLSVEGRMTICNMAIEAGAKVGLIAPDETTIDYVKKNSFLDEELFNQAKQFWKSLRTDDKAVFDNEIEIDVSKIKPQVTWGTSPEMVVNFDDPIPTIIDSNEENKKNVELARSYMGIQNESKLSDLVFDKVFIGSCTNSRIEDLRQAAEIVKGKTIAENISEAIVVPGSGLVKEQAENEGLDKVFTDAGFTWRDPGCSMCLGMNPDQLKPHERCASTSNRNFEGRQGYLGRTHLMSPIMAAFTAINGTVGDPS